MKPLLGLTPGEMQQACRALGLPAFVGKQVAGWIYQKRVPHIDDMKNVGKAGWQAVKQEANRQAKKFNRSAQNGTVAEDYGLNKPTNQQDSIPGQEQAQPGIVEQMGQKVIDAGIDGAINQANQTNTGRVTLWMFRTTQKRKPATVIGNTSKRT